MRAVLLAVVLALSWIAAAVAQAPTPTERRWSVEGREPQWRARFEVAGGEVDSVSVLRRDEAGLVLHVGERRNDSTSHFIERRDRAGQIVWRHPVPGLPARHNGVNLLAVEGRTRADLTLAAVFNPIEAKPGDAFARIIEVDITKGALQVVGSFGYPDKKRGTTDDWLELTHAKALPSGLIVFYGGVGSGPFWWWVGLRKPDGTVIWDVISKRGLGHVVDLRADGDGYDVVLVNVMSLDQRLGTGAFRLRIDAAGRVAASVKLWQDELAPRFTPDGGMARLTTHENQPTVVEVKDRRGLTQFVRSLPGDTYTIDRCLDDGTIVLNRKDGFLFLAADGRSMISASDSNFQLSTLPDGTLVHLHCEGEGCKVRTLSLFDRPR